MAMATSLQQYLERAHVEYDIVPHDYANSSLGCADAAHIPGAQLAKPVLFSDAAGYLMAVLPASHRINAGELKKRLRRHLEMVPESQLSSLFGDCAKGAVPPLGQAYGVPVIWDDALSACPDIYFEAGDHRDLVHMSGQAFRTLMANADHARISHPA